MSHSIAALEQPSFVTARTSRRRFRHFACGIAMLSADIISFGLAYLLFRDHAFVPQIVVLTVRDWHLPPVDVFFIVAVLFVFTRYLVRDYSKRQLFWDSTRYTTRAVAVAAAADILLMLPLGAQVSATAIILCWLFLVPAIPLIRQGMRLVLSKLGLWYLPTVVIGSNKDAASVVAALQNHLSLGFALRFHVPWGNSTAEEDQEIAGLKTVPPSANVASALYKLGCEQVVVATNNVDDEQLTHVLENLITAEFGVVIAPKMRRIPLFGLTVNTLFGKDLVLLELRNHLVRLHERVIKRVLDFVCSVFLLTVLTPVFVAISYAIRKDDGGPAFFVQRRVGRHGQEFSCYKFRTMALNSEELLARWEAEGSPFYQRYVASNFKLDDDPRVTRVGRWLRKTSLDELPQLWNVLIGQMSIVGPRPLIPREIQEYGDSFDLYCRVRPGITGLWQISGRSMTRFEDRVTFDEWYIRNWSIWYDFVIVIQTFWIVIGGRGAY